MILRMSLWFAVPPMCLCFAVATASGDLEPGTMVVVVDDDAPLKLGAETLLVLEKGARHQVVQIQDDWVGLRIERNGSRVGGWIKRELVEEVVAPPEPVVAREPAPKPDPPVAMEKPAMEKPAMEKSDEPEDEGLVDVAEPKPEMEKPVTQDPVEPADPTVEESVAEAADPEIAKPAMEKPAIDDDVEPTPDKPAMEKPDAGLVASEEAESAIVERTEPAMEKPDEDKPAMEKPETEKPADDPEPAEPESEEPSRDRRPDPGTESMIAKADPAKPLMRKVDAPKPEMEKKPAPEPIAEQDLRLPGSFRFKSVRSNRKVDGLDLEFRDRKGGRIDLEKYRGSKNVVLVIMRGYAGFVCPLCTTQTSRLIANYDRFVERDAEILVVYPGPADKIDEYLEKSSNLASASSTPFPVLLDVDLKAVSELGIEGDLANPATYILDREGNVRFAYVGRITTDRPSLRVILEELDALAGEG